VIQLDGDAARGSFDDEDALLLTCVACQASLSVEYAQLHEEMLQQAQLKNEMDFAQAVQRHFLPKIPAQSQGYLFSAHYVAAGKVGGDYYDFVALPDGTQVVLLADVSGKGVPAALMMAKLSSMCGVALLSCPGSVADAMSAINREVCRASVGGAHVTLALCAINPTAHEVAFVNAGHPSPVICRADGKIAESAGNELCGLPLGVDKDAQYQTTSTTLAIGESVLLFSDGITEATNSAGQSYSHEGLCEFLSMERGTPPARLGAALLADVRSHMGDSPQDDDISLVVFQRVSPVQAAVPDDETLQPHSLRH
jgi:serine phosphatase RsbU (regulator of sigma subunit)